MTAADSKSVEQILLSLFPLLSFSCVAETATDYKRGCKAWLHFLGKNPCESDVSMKYFTYCCNKPSSLFLSPPRFLWAGAYTTRGGKHLRCPGLPRSGLHTHLQERRASSAPRTPLALTVRLRDVGEHEGAHEFWQYDLVTRCWQADDHWDTHTYRGMFVILSLSG